MLTRLIPMPIKNNALLLLALLCLVVPAQAQQQHAMHNMAMDSDVSLETMPANDAVLVNQPEMLMLHFGSMVRLVKLAVKTPGGDLVDIGFRYRPVAGHEFMQSLPSLPEEDYYTVEWAMLDENDALVKGSFYFAFGAEARPPSYYLDQMEQMRHIMAPDYRLLSPALN